MPKVARIACDYTTEQSYENYKRVGDRTRTKAKRKDKLREGVASNFF
jgi:hypothetical protein